MLKMQNILLLVLIIIVIYKAKSERPSITTPLGTVKGYYKKSWKNIQYDAYEGVPYAQRPVGILRFQPPVPLSKWPTVIDAVSPSQACPQYNKVKRIVKGDEDCLYLNIYVSGISKEKKEKLPILFWIHGGGFMFGSSSSYKAKYLMDRKLILVTINYRLGPFGFLCTGDEIVSGNMGLKDQNLALRWVSENIEYFGGDPKRITLGGISAGGASVHYHYLSPMSSGLFQHGMSFSGTAVAKWAFTPDNSKTEATIALATSLNCPLSNSTILVECLKGHSVKQIVLAVQEKRDIAFLRVMFTPVAEVIEKDYFINSSPSKIINSGKIFDVPWITGVVRDEGTVKALPIVISAENTQDVNQHWEDLGPNTLDILNSNIPRSQWAYLLNSAWKHYLGNDPLDISDRNSVTKFTDLIGDCLISISAQRAAKYQAAISKSPVYFYYYSYAAAYNCMSKFPKITSLGDWVCHGDDTNFVLEPGDIYSDTTPNDREMLNKVLDFWYSIISTGKPDLGVRWLDVGSSEDFQYMHIAGPTNNQMKINNNLGDTQFWTNIEQTGSNFRWPVYSHNCGCYMVCGLKMNRLGLNEFSAVASEHFTAPPISSANIH